MKNLRIEILTFISNMMFEDNRFDEVSFDNDNKNGEIIFKYDEEPFLISTGSIVSLDEKYNG